MTETASDNCLNHSRVEGQDLSRAELGSLVIKSLHDSGD